MSLHDSVLRIRSFYYPTKPDEEGMCPSCGCTYDQETCPDECPECGQSSYVILNIPLTALNFS